MTDDQKVAWIHVAAVTVLCGFMAPAVEWLAVGFGEPGIAWYVYVGGWLVMSCFVYSMAVNPQ